MTNDTNRTKNERKLTEDEKSAFLTSLGELCLEYGVDFDLEETHCGYSGSITRLAIVDSAGQVLFDDSVSFDQSAARYFTGQGE